MIRNIHDAPRIGSTSFENTLDRFVQDGDSKFHHLKGCGVSALNSSWKNYNCDSLIIPCQLS